MFSHYFNLSFLIHSQQVNDCCFSRSRLLATKRLISLEDSPDRPSLGVHIRRQRKARWKRRRWPRAGSIQLQETPCQLSHCAQVNGGSSARCREGTGKQASSLSHRKIHSVHQELTLITFSAIESAPYECLQAYSEHRLQLRQEKKAREWLAIQSNIPNQHLVFFTGLFNHLQVTCVGPTP